MFFVYYLLHPENADLLYIGRGLDPQNRLRAFERRKGVPAVLSPFMQRFSSFEKACAAELAAITKHNPPFNLVLVSSPGCYGKKIRVTAQAKRNMSKASKGKPKSPEHRANISAARKALSPEIKRKAFEASYMVRWAANRGEQN